MTDIAAETSEPAAGGAATTSEGFELRVELDASYESLAAHGRALASLLLAIHGWLDTQEAERVDVMLDGRRFTLRGGDRDSP